MKQHPKRKDLARLNVSVPKEVYDVVKKESEAKNESLSIVVSRFLEEYLDIRKKITKE